MSLINYQEIDPGPLATQIKEMFEREENFGLTLQELNNMDAETYARHLAGWIEYEV
tara:strand:- start:57 stop:224 length:168 start_codon:yes stop_codon:yes gene_type:complete